MPKLLDHQIAPEPLKNWLIYAPTLGGKTFAVVDYLRNHPSEKALMIGSPYNHTKLDKAVHSIEERTGLFLEVDFCDQENMDLFDVSQYDLVIFENLETRYLQDYRQIIDANPSIRLIVTTSQNEVVQYILDTGSGFDINVSKSVFGNPYIDPTHPKFAEFQAFKRI